MWSRRFASTSQWLSTVFAPISFGLDRIDRADGGVGWRSEPTSSLACDDRHRRSRWRIRMAYVATVSTHDATGGVITTKRFAATAHDGPDVMVERISGELRHLRARHGDAPISIVQDGAPELWTLAKTVRARAGIEAAHEVIDRFYVDERLAAICECLGAAGWDLWQLWSHDLEDAAIRQLIGSCDGSTTWSTTPRAASPKETRRRSTGRSWACGT